MIKSKNQEALNKLMSINIKIAYQLFMDRLLRMDRERLTALSSLCLQLDYENFHGKKRSKEIATTASEILFPDVLIFEMKKDL